jgi:hypothetical protein
VHAEKKGARGGHLRLALRFLCLSREGKWGEKKWGPTCGAIKGWGGVWASCGHALKASGAERRCQ